MTNFVMSQEDFPTPNEHLSVDAQNDLAILVANLSASQKFALDASKYLETNAAHHQFWTGRYGALGDALLLLEEFRGKYDV